MTEEFNKRGLLRKFRKLFGFRRVWVGSLCLFVALFWSCYFTCYISPPRFNGSPIKIFRNAGGEPFFLTENEDLYHRIDEWLSSKRLCYPYPAYFYPHLGLYECREDENSDSIWTKIIIWDDRIIYERVGATLPWTSFFYTKKDVEIKSEIETWHSIQSRLTSQSNISQENND